MNRGMRDIAGHHRWATAQIIAACSTLDAAALESTVPGTYGTIIETLRHTLDAESSYLFRITGFWPERPWQAGEPVGLEVLAERATFLADALDRLIASEWDDERMCEARAGQTEMYHVPAGVILAQLLHHANEHRAHICTILGAIGVEAPDVSAWGYSIETGRATLKNAAQE
jgi:uncharacterized damage-inducible protein DinB